MKIALFGGSFDPLHQGHTLLANRILKTGVFDYVWWLPVPDNPFKPKGPQTTLSSRIAHLQTQLTNPRMKIWEHCDTYLITTLKKLRLLYPHIEFVFVAGFDSSLHFHRWQDWRTILSMVPIIFVNRAPNRIGTCVPRLRHQKNVVHLPLSKLKQGLGTYQNNCIIWMGGGPTSDFSSSFTRATLDKPLK